jgi:hypothetical protein
MAGCSGGWQSWASIGKPAFLLTLLPCPPVALPGPPAQAYFAEHFPQLRAMRPSEGLSDFIIDVTTTSSLDWGNSQGDGGGSPNSAAAAAMATAAAFADVYAASELQACNHREADALLAAAAAAAAGPDGGNGPGHGSHHHHRHKMPHPLGLGRSQGTATPWWWGLAVLLRYRSGEGGAI